MTTMSLFLWFIIFAVATVVAINGGYFDPDDDAGPQPVEIATLAVGFIALWFFCVWTWEAGNGLLSVLP